MRRLRYLVITMSIIAGLGAALFGAAVYVSGHTPGRWMDYAQQRLAGHPKLEAVALPVISVARRVLDEPSPDQRAAEPFVAPPPPPRWAAQEDAAPAQPDAGGRVWRVGPDGPLRSIAEAARLARDGDVVEIAAGDYRGDVAVWLQRRLTIRGVGGNARIFADGRYAEGKAIWVIRDGQFRVSNIDFVGVRVPDRNGAGIRFENGHLVVRNCLFWDSESGILTASGPRHRGARLEIEGSEFGYLGDGIGQAHGVYAGDIAELRVSGSYFHHGNVGHLIKSRAAVNDIRHNRITDEADGRASYQIDLPSGGVAYVVGNLVQQGRRAENTALISFGQEGYLWPVNRLYLASNTLVNDHPWGGAVLRARPGFDSIVAANNLRSGPGRYHAEGALQLLNDVVVGRAAFVDAAAHDYRIAPGAGQALRFQRPVVERIDGVALVPQAQYLHPRRTAPLQEPPGVVGAVQ